jgi:ubiquinone/menaquinone biosynthesis C-methylase UbiE
MFLLRRRMNACMAPIHSRLRSRKLDLFFRLARIAPEETLLDLGGGPGFLGEFRRLYDLFGKVTVVNPGIEVSRYYGREIDFVAGDGCTLPFRSRAFDWVFSNAVIEHVGGWQRQKLFADEIRRVARKGYFVATPNRYFPIDPHTFLPFYQFMPVRLQQAVVHVSPVAHYEEINLLCARQLSVLFPEGDVFRTGLPGLAMGLVAFWRADK